MNDPQNQINDQALALAMTLLMYKRAPSIAEIREAVEKACAMASTLSGNTTPPDFESVLSRVQANCNVTVGTESVLVDPTLNVPWLPARKTSINWRFWSRYETWLKSVKGWPGAFVEKLNGLTERTLGLLQDPTRSGEWRTRGMVVGNVQSGKTANYTGVVCKAADAGYKLIIILGGMQNSLRSQTQLRLDEGFFGFNTSQATAYGQAGTNRIGVGLVKSPEELRCHALTGSAENGDFSRAGANMVNVRPGGVEPVYLVVKKHKSILQNLITWLSLQAEDDGKGGPKRIRNLPFLLIDDEADNGSINTREVSCDSEGVPLPDYEVTAINGKIRELLRLFEKSSYVGYTATPFANIFIDPEESTETHGDDLFPRNFIISLPAPSNYIGPAKVFGFDGSVDAGIAPESGLGIVLSANDYAAWLPIPHKNHTKPNGKLPTSMRLAVLDFILACAGRRARGQRNVHNSMLVHVTRFNTTQEAVAEQIQECLLSIQNRVRMGDGGRTDTILKELEARWKTEFAVKFESIRQAIADPMLTPLIWEQIEAELKDAVAPIHVRKINGTAGDTLDYQLHPEGISVIAVGGDKLSRGLTLEGLSVSYFLRTSKMYDTLMQMGRWFGYRPGYADLCRLHLPDDLRMWYRHIALATEELRTELEHMSDIHSTPMEYGLRVRMHPSGMLITGLNKMRNGTPMRVSFNGTLNETVLFDLDPVRIEANADAAHNLMESLTHLGPHQESNRGAAKIWRGVSPDLVVEFLERYKTHQEAKRVDSGMIAKFIRRRVSQGELDSWTVGIFDNKDDKAQRTTALSGFPKGLGLYERVPLEIRDFPDGTVPPVPLSKYTIKRLLSPNNEAADLTDEQYQAALEATRNAALSKNPDKPVPAYALGPYLREQRNRRQGLLLLYPLDPANLKDRKGLFQEIAQEAIYGFAVSFPADTSFKGDGLDYMVNYVYTAAQDFDAE